MSLRAGRRRRTRPARSRTSPAVDHAAHEREIESLRLEQKRLEENNDVIRLMKRRLAEEESRHTGRSGNARRGRPDGGQAGSGGRRGGAPDRERPGGPGATKGRWDAGPARGSLRRTGGVFLGEPLTAGNLFEQERILLDARRAEAERLRGEIEPLKDEPRQADEPIPARVPR